MSDEIKVHPVSWPPAPIKTERLVIRQSEARDRTALIDLFASPEVGTYVGGSRPRDELELALPEIPRQRFGFFVVELNGTTIGMITFDRRCSERKGHIRPEGGEPELGYMFLPKAWGCEYATEACVRCCSRLVYRRASRRAGSAIYPDRQRGLDARRGEAGVHRSGAVQGLRC
jgi:RimJ/RimL family protein N-acetyltransferase